MHCCPCAVVRARLSDPISLRSLGKDSNAADEEDSPSSMVLRSVTRCAGGNITLKNAMTASSNTTCHFHDGELLVVSDQPARKTVVSARPLHGARPAVLMSVVQCAVIQARASRWAAAISISDICSATSRRMAMASTRPFSAARLNHLCAATRLTTPERPLAQ